LNVEKEISKELFRRRRTRRCRSSEIRRRRRVWYSGRNIGRNVRWHRDGIWGRIQFNFRGDGRVFMGKGGSHRKTVEVSTLPGCKGTGVGAGAGARAVFTTDRVEAVTVRVNRDSVGSSNGIGVRG
jgi:hypothetical protein